MITLPWPGPARLTLVLLAAIPAAMAYPWSSPRDRWVLGVAVALIVVLLAWWRGLHLTAILRRRLAMLRQRRGAPTDRRSGPDVRSTVVLRMTSPATASDVLPLPLIASYLNRYGLRADTVRITSRDNRGEIAAATRDTWIGLTFSAAQNLAALQARSAQIPLAETAEVAARRLADHLRELGWETVTAEPGDAPEVFGAPAREKWDGVVDAAGDYVAAYRIGVDDGLPDTLADLWAGDTRETWTVLELSGSPDHPIVAAGAALRTADRPPGAGPLPGLTPEHGSHRSALHALHPLSGQRLAGRTEVPAAELAALRWSVAAAAADSAAGRARSQARHAAPTKT